MAEIKSDQSIPLSATKVVQPDTISLHLESEEDPIIVMNKEGFHYKGELVEDTLDVYLRFNEWLNKANGTDK